MDAAGLGAEDHADVVVADERLVSLAGDLYSGGRLCTLIGVPWRGVSFSTFSTGRFV